MRKGRFEASKSSLLIGAAVQGAEVLETGLIDFLFGRNAFLKTAFDLDNNIILTNCAHDMNEVIFIAH